MSNLVKKISSAVAGVSIVMSIVAPIAGVSAGYDGLDAANKLAGLGIIVDQSSNPSDYRLGDTLTRRENAKTTIKLAGLEVTDACEGKFSDMPSSDWGCKYAEAGLTAGFFAANAKFNPTSNISKGEALKMVLKANGIAPTAGMTPWQAGYVDAAVAAGIAEDFSDYNTPATRSDVFTWAANAVDTEETSVVDDTTGGDDLGGLLGGLLGGDTTDTGSTTTTTTTTTDTGSTTTTTTTTSTGTTTVGAGDLAVSLNPNSPVSGTQIPKTGIVKFSVVDFKAGSSDVSLNSVELVKASLASVPSGTKVWFEKNGTRVSGKTSFTSENNAIISFAPAYVVKAGATESLDLFVETTIGTAGNDLQFASKTISSTAQNTSGSFVTPILRTADYSVATASVKKAGSDTSYNASESTVELGKFTVANTDTSSDTRDIAVKSFLLYQNGTANLTNLSNIVIERNGVVVSSGSTIDGKKLTITMMDTIKDGSTASYVVKANISQVELNTDTYQLYVKNVSDVNIVEVSNSFRVSVTTDNSDTEGAAQEYFKTYSVTGGDIKFERDSTVALDSTVAPGTQDVILMKGKITAKSAVNLENVTLDYTVDGNSNTGAMTEMNTVYLQIGGSTFTWTPANGQASFLGTATINGTADVKLYTKLKDGATKTIKFGELKLGSFATKEYVVNQNTVSSAVGTISAVQVTIGNSTLNLTRTDGLGNTNLASGSKGVKVYGAKFTSTQGNPIALSNLAVATTGTANAYTGNTSLTLYVNGEAKSTKTIAANGSVSFDNFNTTVSTSQSADIEIKADFSDVTTSGTFKIASISYDATDNVTSLDVVKPTVAGAQFTVAQAVGTLAATTGDNMVNKTLLLSGNQTQKIASFKVTATNDTIKLKEVVFTGSNLDALQNVRLVDSSLNVITSASTVTSTGGVFKNVNTSTNTKNTIAIDKSETYYIVADVNSSTDQAGVVINVAVSGSKITGSNGAEVAMIGADVVGVSHDVAQNTFKVTKVAIVSPYSKNIKTNALMFKVDAFGKDVITLSGATFSNSLSGFTGSVVLTVERASDNAVVGTLNATTGTVTFTANNTISAGTSSTFIVKLVGADIDSNSNSNDWTVSLTNLQVGTLNASAYPKNTETLPLTENK